MDLDIFIQQMGAWSAGRGPLHRRLSSAVEHAIRQGLLLPGSKLPAERKLAEALAVSRTTVVTAYHNLRADGWLESRLGSATWVAAGRAGAARKLAHSAAVEGTSLVNLFLGNEAGTVDFGPATPMPLAALPEALFSIAPEVRQALLRERNYMPLGLPMLRDAVARYYKQAGTPTEAGQILITEGGQQAISLVTSLFLQRGDSVLVENPTYFGALQAFRLAGARIASAPVGRRHVDPAAVREGIAANRPRMVYLQPSNQNPTGAVMPETARRDLARLAADTGVCLVEDSTLADLEIGGKAVKPIAAFSEDGAVVTIGSLSKLYWAGLRIGWIRGSLSTIAQLARIKSTADLASPHITQVIASQLLGALSEAKSLRREELTIRRDLLVSLLREHLPDWSFHVPSGGLCLWIQLPGQDARQFTQFASRFGVAITPGSMFSPDETFHEYLRIPFLLDEESIETGVLRLKSAWSAFRDAPALDARRAVAIV